MSYSQFSTQFKTLGSVKAAFGVETREGIRFLPKLEPVEPSAMLQDFLEQSLPVAIATIYSCASSKMQWRFMHLQHNPLRALCDCGSQSGLTL